MGMCANWNSVSANLLFSPVLQDTYKWIWVCWPIQDASLKSGPTAVLDLMLPRLYHPSAAVMSTFVAILCTGYIKGEKMWRCATYVSRFRSLMVRSLIGLYSVNKRFELVDSTGSIHKKYFPLGIHKNPPIPSRILSIAPIPMGGEVIFPLSGWVWLVGSEWGDATSSVYCEPVKQGSPSIPLQY